MTAPAGQGCPALVRMGGLVARCDGGVGQHAPHGNDEYGISWTMPGEMEIHGVPALFDTDGVMAEVEAAEARGITAGQIVAAIRELRPQ